jgi:hypothetical protein
MVIARCFQADLAIWFFEFCEHDPQIGPKVCEAVP